MFLVDVANWCKFLVKACHFKSICFMSSNRLWWAVEWQVGKQGKKAGHHCKIIPDRLKDACDAKQIHCIKSQLAVDHDVLWLTKLKSNANSFSQQHCLQILCTSSALQFVVLSCSPQCSNMHLNIFSFIICSLLSPCVKAGLIWIIFATQLEDISIFLSILCK